MIEKYLEYLKGNGKSPLTIKNYKGDIKQFFKIIKKPMAEISVNDIELYKQYLSERLDQNSIARKLFALKRFFDYLTSQNVISKNPLGTTKIPRTKRKIPKRIDDRLIQKLFLKLSQSPDTFENRLLGAIISLLDTGARKSEIINLKLKDVDIEQGLFKTVLKGGDEAITAFASDHMFFIKRWYELRINLNTEIEEFLVYSKDKDIEWYTVLNDYYLYDVLLYPFMEKVIGTKINPHAFRHNVGFAMKERGAHLIDIQEQLHHKSPTTTAIYVEALDAKKRMQKFHPRG